jgi:hypothetical protein
MALLALFAISSLIIAGLAYRSSCGNAEVLSGALRTVLAFVGLWTLCLTLNLALGITAVLTIRTVTARFLSIYFMNDFALVLFSALQASFLHACLARRAAERAKAS